MKKTIYYFIFFSFIFFLTGCSNDNVSTNNSAEVTRLNADVNVSTSTNLQENTINVVEIQKHVHDTEPIEEEISSFSTKLSGKDTPRTHNISITTGILNETTVEPGGTFSFCGTVGKPTAENGYQEADSFDANGNTVQTLGGGNCQVSSTLYNAVLKVADLKVTERHAHSKAVHYVEKDKDAAVSYGSVDLKFKNNTGNTIKIYASSDLNSVNIRIVKLK